MKFLQRLLNKTAATPSQEKPTFILTPQKKKRTPLQQAQVSWMETFNPLRHLTLQQAQMIFDAARRGCDARLQWIYQNIEEVDPTLMICAERRASALVDLDWTTRTKPARRFKDYDEKLAEEQAAFLSYAYGQAEDSNLFPAIEHLSTAFFRGHAHVAPVYSEDGMSLKGFQLLNAWNLTRNIKDNTWHWNPNADETVETANLDLLPREEVVHFVRSRHIDYPAMAIHLRTTLGEKVWGQFLERYGIPPVIVTMPQDIDPNQVEKFAAAAQSIYEGSVGALPAGSQVHYASEARGVNPFKEFLDHQQQLMVLMATGGMLTSLTGATGIGQGASDAHEETWRTIVRRDAALIATALNRTVTDTLLDRAFPNQPHLAQFDFETDPQPSAMEVFDLAGKAVTAGYKISQDELEERTGYTLSENAPTPDALGGGVSSPFLMNKAAPTSATFKKEFAALATALQVDLSPAAEAVQTFLADPTAEKAAWLMSVLPQLLPEDPQAALILEQSLAQSYASNLPTIAQNGECRARDPAKCRVHGQHPGQGQRERDTKERTDSLGKKFDPKHPERYSEGDNIKRGEKAIKRAISKKEDVLDAMYRPECGSIDFLWGSASTYGIAHALAGHSADIEKLPEIIAKGEAYMAKTKDKTGHEDFRGRIAFVHGKCAVFVDPLPKGKSFVVSGYRKDSEIDWDKLKKNPRVKPSGSK